MKLYKTPTPVDIWLAGNWLLRVVMAIPFVICAPLVILGVLFGATAACASIAAAIVGFDALTALCLWCSLYERNYDLRAVMAAKPLRYRRGRPRVEIEAQGADVIVTYWKRESTYISERTERFNAEDNAEGAHQLIARLRSEQPAPTATPEARALARVLTK